MTSTLILFHVTAK